jgi:hypothetical protein
VRHSGIRNGVRHLLDCGRPLASAGVNGTLEIGDFGDQDRYVTATNSYRHARRTDCDPGMLRRAGGYRQNYRATADTIVYATCGLGGELVVGKTFAKACSLHSSE